MLWRSDFVLESGFSYGIVTRAIYGMPLANSVTNPVVPDLFHDGDKGPGTGGGGEKMTISAHFLSTFPPALLLIETNLKRLTECLSEPRTKPLE